MNPIEMLRGQVGQLWNDDPAVKEKKGLGGGGANMLQGLLTGLGGVDFGGMIQGFIGNLLGGGGGGGGIMGMLGGLFGGGGGGGGIGNIFGSLFSMMGGNGAGPGSLLSDLSSFAENDSRRMG